MNMESEPSFGFEKSEQQEAGAEEETKGEPISPEILAETQEGVDLYTLKLPARIRELDREIIEIKERGDDVSEKEELLTELREQLELAKLFGEDLDEDAKTF